MLEYQREDCSSRSVMLASSLFCSCGTPFVDKYRHAPCYHVICSNCVLRNPSRDKCPVCNARSETLQLIHPNDALHICTSNGCNKAFLNFQSLRGHASIAHEIDVESAVEFYTHTGDATVQFGDVQRILQDPVSSVTQNETDEPEQEDVDMKTDQAMEAKPKRSQNVEKSTLVEDKYRERQQADDLEELM
ncbi:zinc finger containing protein [Babesia ovata]|uniref:Zinc finger containing protein n=1 Tax=Babesia ovata TaxID=189622 RepID=A0A2H6KC35_9APIC|nr:zinc finger containing protein [Babesia ovata]GBE60560.1 zinc finger containing protein [Babesia ovata]